MRVGIFGGSFNPPHLGHLVIAEWMRGEFALDRILWIPASQSPFKDAASLPDPDRRLEMAQLAAQDNPAFTVSDVEVRRGGASYTIDTLRHLIEAQPETEFNLLMGSDSLSSFDRWRDAERILELADLLVFRRPGEPAPELSDRIMRRVSFANAPRLEISATVIRERCRLGQSIRYLVPEPVRMYIDRHGLYTQH